MRTSLRLLAIVGVLLSGSAATSLASAPAPGVVSMRTGEVTWTERGDCVSAGDVLRFGIQLYQGDAVAAGDTGEYVCDGPGEVDVSVTMTPAQGRFHPGRVEFELNQMWCSADGELCTVGESFYGESRLTVDR